eukprot:maker-scaffold_14-snap-gene-3.16-mRNA-1 protein AED:0.08 eAED:0.08 QI:70/0/0.5/0.5/0/0/2/90/207
MKTKVPYKAVLIKDALEFWFPKGRDVHHDHWFKSTEELDRELEKKFGPSLEGLRDKKEQEKYKTWLESKEGRLAYILLTDQFPRNIYRGKKEAFAFDHLALGIAMEYAGDEEKFEKTLKEYTHEELQFLYIPLMHSEDAKTCKLCCTIFEKLSKEVSPKYQQNYEYAIKHHDILSEFGRYPHRNNVLGRKHTPDEQKYMETADRFGQ